MDHLSTSYNIVFVLLLCIPMNAAGNTHGLTKYLPSDRYPVSITPRASNWPVWFKTSRPPGGASSIRFTDEETSHAQPEKASVKNYMKSSILIGVRESAPAEQPSAAATGIVEGILETSAGEAAVSGEIQELQAAGNPPKQVKEEAEATGVSELKNDGMEKGKLAALNAEPADEGNAAENVGSNIHKTGETQQQPASRARIPPGGYSTLKLW